MKRTFKLIFTAGLLSYCVSLYGQDSLKNKVMTIQTAWNMALRNSTQLKIIAKNVEEAHQQTEIEKLNKLPAISTGLDYAYLSNINVWTPTFSKHTVEDFHHQYTQFSTTAAETVFKGDEVKNTILRSTFQEQVAALTLGQNIDEIKLLVAAKYLDIFGLINQRQVYLNNIKLAQNRLKNVLAMQKQGMVTQNDVLRTQLTISDYKLSLVKVNDNISIYNKQMNMVIGLPDTVLMVPDSNLLHSHLRDDGLDSFLKISQTESHELKIAAVNNRIAETNIKLAGSDRYPEIYLFSANNLQRPFTTSIPAYDIFYNIWQAGIGIRYNISSIYQSPRKIKAGKLQLEESIQNETLTRQNLDVNVNAAYIQYHEAIYELQTDEHDLGSAEENYRIVEKKYFNQLALLTDMIDAANTKIEAELKVTNAQINMMYTYYVLLKTIGTI
jgi:outer membrane protein